MVTFKINNTDFAGHIIAGTYAVNLKPVYKDWVDAARVTHRRTYRQKISGSFEMFFRTASEYSSFKSACAAALTSNGSVAASLSVNGLIPLASANLFIDYDLTRDRDGNWQDYFKKFKVTIEEA